MIIPITDGEASQSQPCGPGRVLGRGGGRVGPFKHDALSSSTTPPDVVVGQGQSVNMNGNVNVNWNVNVTVNVNMNESHSGCIKDGRKCECDDEDVKVSRTRTSRPTHQTETEPFDIYPPKQGGGVVLETTLLVNNTESSRVLRPGMVLLKSFISISDQVNIVKRCKELGMGSGNQRPSDGYLLPYIPPEFHSFVHDAIRYSNSLIEHSKTPNSNFNPHHLFPPLSPDICIGHFYSQDDQLGLHQDKDESEESIRGGLPVVSFSIGDSADFLYHDEWDVYKALKFVLESGDVLIFGGTSRNIIHGVTAIYPMTAPSLLQPAKLRPGQLNLSFRK